jgi:hypothetical protein
MPHHRICLYRLNELFDVRNVDRVEISSQHNFNVDSMTECKAKPNPMNMK